MKIYGQIMIEILIQLSIEKKVSIVWTMSANKLLIFIDDGLLYHALNTLFYIKKRSNLTESENKNENGNQFDFER